MSDLTYLRTEEGFLYLALVTDKFSRKIVGYHCGDTLEAVGCVQAFGDGFERPAGAHPIHHSDQGAGIAATSMSRHWKVRGLPISMTGRWITVRKMPWPNG